MTSLADIAILLIFGLCLYFAWLAVQAREYAYSIVVRYCKSKDLLLLEQSVSFKAAWLKRDPNGRLRCWRSYQFEFSSTGDERYHGLIILLGRRIERIDLEPYRLPPSPESEKT